MLGCQYSPRAWNFPSKHPRLQPNGVLTLESSSLDYIDCQAEDAMIKTYIQNPRQDTMYGILIHTHF